MDRGFRTSNLNLDKIIQNKISQDSSFLHEEVEEDQVMKALTLILTYIKQIDEKNSKQTQIILKQQEEIIELLKKK